MSLITFDWETYYDKDYQLKKMTTEEYIRSHKFEPIGFGYRIECEPPEWVTGTDAYIERRLRELRLEEHRVVMHNAPFDAGILSYRYNIHPKFIYDTLSMARPLIVDVKNGGSLDKLSQRFGLGEKGKEVIKAFGKRKPDFTPAELAEYGEYCKNDVVLTYLLFHVLQHFSTPQECYMIDMLIRMYTDPVLILDRDVLKQHLAEVQAKKAALMAQIDSTIGRKALMSNPQFAQLLQDLGIDPPMKISPKTGKVAYAFSKKDVEFNDLLEHPDERVQTLVAARLGVKSTQEETRTESFMRITYRGAMPVPLRYYAAHTGRAGGWDKINLQNLPRGGNLRRSMAAPEGHMLVACDSSQIEARITAWLAGQDDLVADFAAGEDVYSKFASVVYGRKVDRKRKEVGPDGKEFAPDFEQGFVGKTCLAEGTLVLCDTGWKEIQQVTTQDKLWDGENWVCHSGLLMNGMKHVLNLSGLWLTPDHQVWLGTQWKDAESLGREPSVLSQALEFAAGSCRSLDISLAHAGVLDQSSCNVTAMAGSTQLMSMRSSRSGLHDVRLVPGKLERASGTGSTLASCQMMPTAHGYSTDYLLRSLDATPPRMPRTSTMGSGASQCTQNGGKTVLRFSSTCSPYLDGIARSLRWTASTLMGDMSQAISGLCHVVRTYTTSVRSPTLKPKSGSLKRVYDLTNAGPLHRFTVLTARGPLIVSNCILGLGFGMGKDNFQRTLKIGQGGFTLEMDIADCERTVNIYRTQYPMIPKLWKSAEEAIKAMAKGNEYELGVGIKLKCDHRGVHLPNGMIQRYDGLRWMKADGDKYRQDGYYYNSKYGPKYLYGPKLVENIVQALARIVVFNQMAIIDQKMKKFDRKMHPDARFKVVLTVHDEVLCVCPTAAVPKVEAMMLEVMSKPPRWAPELPIACEASHGRNYAEAK